MITFEMFLESSELPEAKSGLQGGCYWNYFKSDVQYGCWHGSTSQCGVCLKPNMQKSQWHKL